MEAEKKALVIVESPAKARTLNRYLGRGYNVKASMGHVRDLPEKELGVDVDDNFKPHYQSIPGKRKVIAELKKAARVATDIYLASDPDREGEAIAWHIASLFDKQSGPIHRVLLNEITAGGVKAAMNQPSQIDQHKVEAQQARRVLDRLVGYKVSPILWRTIKGGSSAGRVQTVALRLICEREAEINAFVAEEYWSITALLAAGAEPFEAELVKVDGEKPKIGDEESARSTARELEKREFRVKSYEEKEKSTRPSPPFITSTLQQEASRRFGFSPQKTMRIAQQLYEGLEARDEGLTGLITYMRTDSVRVADEARRAAGEYIRSALGPAYAPDRSPLYRNKSRSQDAHEAIRPTDIRRDPEAMKGSLTPEQHKVYGLVWSRFTASQMTAARFKTVTCDIAAGPYLFRASGSRRVFDGYQKVYPPSKEEEKGLLPALRVDQVLELREIKPEQHFTKPPPRYNDASLIKELESKGIGRPSTFATIVETIKARKYVDKDEGRFMPTELGLVVNRLLVKSFPDIFDVDFTAGLEEELDRIETGQVEWVQVLRDFYKPFSERLDQVSANWRELKGELEEQTEITCEECGRPMVIKWGRNGRFLGCTGYPECRHTRPLPGQEDSRGADETDEACPECGLKLVIRRSRFGRFYACSGFPKCRYKRPFTLNIACPEPDCGGHLVEKKSRKGRQFYGCSNYPKCRFATWDKPVAERCPSCDYGLLVEKTSRSGTTRKVCPSCETEVA